MAYRTQMQQITAGSQFNGAAPTTAVTSGNGKRTFATDTVGGLFALGPTEPGHVMGVALYADGANDLDGGTWVISKVTAEGDDFELFSGTTETEFASDASERVLMLPGESIKVVTTGMSVDMRCMVSTDFDLPGGAD